ncbi:WXG100 family type VII secretion target [Streptomyces sp. NPDC048639]|uniref:WXG100 family type VII secretion target n=1 Tax=Streptomyces sp. NPDC048639 TaxID=3365581 RepID=UPI0037197D82
MAYSVMNIDTGALSRVSTDMAKQTSEIEHLLTALENNIEGLMAGWVGPANVRYNTFRHEWRAAAKSLNAALSDVSLCTNRMAANYEECEALNSQMW